MIVAKIQKARLKMRVVRYPFLMRSYFFAPIFWETKLDRALHKTVKILMAI